MSLKPGSLLVVMAMCTALSAAAGAAPNGMVLHAASAASGGLPSAAHTQELDALRAAHAQQQVALERLQSRLAAAESASGWLPWLALALVASAGLTLWLALRARTLHRAHAARNTGIARHENAEPFAAPPAAQPTSEAHSGFLPDVAWRHSDTMTTSGPSTGGSRHGGTAGLAPSVSGARSSVMSAVVRGAAPPAAPPLAAEPPVPAQRPAQPFSLGTGVPPREVSVEELLDLEQQVDFFVVLGQADAAVDLLVSHLRATGGASALPYLKLLEIYRAQGNEEDYERTRSRFNSRFSAQAPAWGGDLNAGRLLEHYPETLERLQALWPMPMRAQHEIGTLLHQNELEPEFDLPAFRDLLMLHGVVGDLLGHPVPVHVNDVDILLPLSEDMLDTTSPQPHLASRPLPKASANRPLMSRHEFDLLRDTDDSAPGTGSARPSDKLDLDLSDFAPAPRDFTEPAAFTDVNLFRDSRRSGFAPLAEELQPSPKAPPA